MSKEHINIPYLDINQLEQVKLLHTIARGGSNGWLLGNRLQKEYVDNSLMLFINDSKISFQIDVLIEKLTTLQDSVRDFTAGNLDPYIDEFNKYPDFDTNGNEIPFDPYSELESLLATDGIEDLPFKIEDFAELLYFTQSYSLREKLLKEAFNSFFGDKIMMHFVKEDEEGNVIMISENEMPQEVVESYKQNAEVESGLKSIGIEHSLDNYNKWFITMTRLVSQRRPFTEMIPLFK